MSHLILYYFAKFFSTNVNFFPEIDWFLAICINCDSKVGEMICCIINWTEGIGTLRIFVHRLGTVSCFT